MIRPAAGLAALLCFAAWTTGPATAAAPTLTRLEPSGGARGSTVEVTAVGSFGDWPGKAWVEGVGVAVEPLKERGKFKFTIAVDAPPGPRWVRILNAEGASPPRPFHVGTLPEAKEVEPNDAPKAAQKLEKPSVVVNGRLEKSGDVDGYLVPLQKGRTLVAAIDSRAAFGTPMDGVIQIASPAGFVLAQNDDDVGSDPRVVFVAPRDGDYVVRVFAFPATPDSSIRFAGGEGYLYRLTLTDGPYLALPFPLAVAGAGEKVGGLGWNLGPEKHPLVPTADPEVALLAAPAWPNVATVDVVPKGVEAVVEPSTDAPVAVRTLPVPVVLSGRIGQPREKDVFRFEAKKGVRLSIRVEAKRVGSPLDPVVKVYDPSGAVVYEGDDSGRGDRDIDATFTPTADGPHRLVVADLHGRGDDRLAYRLRLGPPVPDFALTLAEDRTTVKPGIPATLKVNVNRINGYDKPIEIRATGLPAGATSGPVVSSPKGDTAKSVTLKIEAGTGPFAGPFRVEGVEPDGANRARPARFAVTDVARPVFDAWLAVLAPPPPPPKPKEEPKPKPKEEPKAKAKEKAAEKDKPKPKPKDEPKPKPKVEAKTADAGAEVRHWAFAPLSRAVPPPGAAHPVDAFLDARLRAEGRTAAPQADKESLVRRLTLDLLGLPPTPEEVDAFLADARPDAYEHLVDRLLARPEYGERHARHWFDVVRYAESNGYERDGAKPGVWRYRDYVIRALNDDRPFGRFLTEQIAGDELPDATPETRTATTFLRLGTWDDEPADELVDRYDQLDDVVGTVSAAFLGVTLRCARCHDHKFEPFSQVDYHRMLAVFEPLTRPQRGRDEFEWPVCSPAEFDALRAEFDRRALGRAAVNAGAGAGLVGAFGPFPTAYVWRELGPEPKPTRLLKRGDPTKPGETVSPGVPAALGFPIAGEPVPTSFSSGRRLWLARWLSAPGNPLVPRVIVNRVWQWRFGRGIAAGANDLGVAGEAPTHPELLDWLAGEHLRNGGRLKPLIRLIVTSRAYRRVSGPPSEGNLLDRFPRRRLEAEAVRDGMLTVAGALEPARYGPGVYPELPKAVLEGQSRPGEGWGKSTEREASRRSVYLFAKRSLAVPELELLDAPDTTASCERRPTSITGPQALTFLNGDFARKTAARLADRLEREAGPRPGDRVERAYRLALGRRPTPAETAAALAFLERGAAADGGRGALESFALVTLNLNEFVYLP